MRRRVALVLAKAPGDRFATGAALAGVLVPGQRTGAEALLRALPWT